MKSSKNIVRDILKAQGLPWDTEPAPEAVRVLEDALSEKWRAGYDDADYEHNMNMN